jgi:hypothetical protein
MPGGVVGTRFRYGCVQCLDSSGVLGGPDPLRKADLTGATRASTSNDGQNPDAASGASAEIETG